MLLHNVPVLLVERTRVGEDTVGDVHLADIVQKRCEAERLGRLFCVAELAGERFGGGTDLPQMPPRCLVVGLSSGCEQSIVSV